MIKRLNVVIVEDAKGELETAYLGRDRTEARKVFAKLVAEGKAAQVAAYRQPKPVKSKRPARMAEANAAAKKERDARLRSAKAKHKKGKESLTPEEQRVLAPWLAEQKAKAEAKAEADAAAAKAKAIEEAAAKAEAGKGLTAEESALLEEVAAEAAAEKQEAVDAARAKAEAGEDLTAEEQLLLAENPAEDTEGQGAD